MKPMTRDTFGNIVFTIAAARLFTFFLYWFRGPAENSTGYAAMVWALLATFIAAGGVYVLIKALRRWIANR